MLLCYVYATFLYHSLRASVAKTGNICYEAIRHMTSNKWRLFVQALTITCIAVSLLNLHRHDLAVAHRGAGLVCYSVTYRTYKSACRAVYAIPLSHIRDIRELARNFLESDRIIFQTPY